MTTFGVKFSISNHIVGGRRTFIVAEIGQNHQGDLHIAKEMIKSAKKAGADCVKFQKSCLKEKFTANALARSYQSVNSWAETYGKHKEFLEFNVEQYRDLQSFANDVGILFTASAMDAQSLDDLYDLNVPVIKIGSGDANNFPLIECAAEHSTPLIISTGMQTEDTVRRIVATMNSNGKSNFCLMHCVSAYPTPPNDVRLRTMNLFQKWFPNVCVGYSGHEQGVLISCAAVLLGAKVIERHFTLDKTQKGTDHKLSLEPSEFKRMVDVIRSLEAIDRVYESSDEILESLQPFSMNQTEIDDIAMSLIDVDKKRILNSEMICRQKLGKSLVYQCDLKSGTILSRDHIVAKVSEPLGVSAEEIDRFVGRTLRSPVSVDDILAENQF